MISNVQASLFDRSGNWGEAQADARRSASKLFEKAYGRGLRGRLMAKLNRKANDLQILSRQAEASHRSMGVLVVPLSKIVGSEGRSEDFDANFNPLKRHNQERWINVAVARWMGVALPAVELVQAGNEYYIRDGHHRISVAKAMGQLDIEARIVN